MPVNNLNLLPPELAVSKNLNSFLKTVRALGVIGIAAFLIFGVGVGAYFIFATISLNGINANVTKLTSQVSAQQKSEQQIVLIKDRLAKIASIRSLPDSLSNQKAIEPFLSDLSADSSLRELNIDPTFVLLSMNIKTNSDLSTFLESFQSSDVFKTVNLVSFSLSSSNGYSVEIKAVK
jgi:hypothetical protein